jgi:hypothetical protein
LAQRAKCAPSKKFSLLVNFGYSFARLRQFENETGHVVNQILHYGVQSN